MSRWYPRCCRSFHDPCHAAKSPPHFIREVLVDCRPAPVGPPGAGLGRAEVFSGAVEVTAPRVNDGRTDPDTG
jgi:hypothetical protein